MTYSTYVVFVMQAPRVDLCELSLQSVSGTPAILGPAYDAPCELAASLYVNDSKRDIVEAALLRAKEARDDETVRQMHWELAMMDLLPVVQDGTSPWHGATYEHYAEVHHLVLETVAYARDRARETHDLRLRIRYLEFALRRCEPQTGRTWIDLQRELLVAYREYVDGCRTGSARDPYTGVHIYDALTRVRALLAVRGVVPEVEAPGWATWIFELADGSRALPGDTGFKHRWVADYLDVLRSLPSAATSQDLRNELPAAALGCRQALRIVAHAPLHRASDHQSRSRSAKVLGRVRHASPNDPTTV